MVPVREATFLLFFGPKVAAQRRDVFSFSVPFPRSGRLGRMIDVLLWLLRPRGATWKCSRTFAILMIAPFFISPGVGVEEANLPDVLEHWTLREYVELAFLRAVTGSSGRRNLQSVLLCLEEQESMEAFDFALVP